MLFWVFSERFHLDSEIIRFFWNELNVFSELSDFFGI